MGDTLAINGVTCGIHIDPTGEEYGIQERYDEPGATVWFQCAWFDRYDLLQGLLGTASYSNGQVKRTPPFAYPLPVDQIAVGNQLPNRMVCTSVGEVRGIKLGTDYEGESDVQLPGWSYYNRAYFPAYFTVPLWQVDDLPPSSPDCDISTLPYVVTKMRVSGEVVAPPTGSIIYGGGAFAGKALQDATAGFIRPRLEISMTMVRMPIHPLNTIMDLEWTINGKPWTIAGFQFPKGSILFTGANSEPRPDPCSFGIVQDVELTFLANGPASGVPQGGQVDVPLDWNYFLDPSGNWVPCTFNTDPPTPIFAYEDFSQFFNADIS
jgi:hypothetical protein